MKPKGESMHGVSSLHEVFLVFCRFFFSLVSQILETHGLFLRKRGELGEEQHMLNDHQCDRAGTGEDLRWASKSMGTRVPCTGGTGLSVSGRISRQCYLPSASWPRLCSQERASGCGRPMGAELSFSPGLLAWSISS